MNLYERIKASVTPKDAAERYGLTVNSNGMARCPFHPDKHPSMKLYDDHVYCFSCHAAGDVIDLTAKIFGCSNHDAAWKLAADYGIDPTKPPVALRLRKPREQNMEKLCGRFLTEYFQLLKGYKRNFVPKGTLELVDERYLEACRNIDGIEYLLDCMDKYPEETVQAMEDNGLTRWLARRLDEEECHGEETKAA